jgi:hypothetical protein
MSGPQIQYRNHHTQRLSGALLPMPLLPPVVALGEEAACKGGTSLKVRQKRVAGGLWNKDVWQDGVRRFQSMNHALKVLEVVSLAPSLGDCPLV